jgi:hypothetical protein
MTEYTIAAIPTVYRGRTYRSRLEAKWAAFFDRLGWRHEYEPFDLGSWSPDFLLPDLDTLVEVKPWTEFDQDTAFRIAQAAEYKQILLTMAAPKIEGGLIANLGWFLGDEGWHHAFVGWLRHEGRPQFNADIVFPASKDGGAGTPDGWQAAGGEFWATGDVSQCLFPYHDHTMKLWVDACNAVQWEPGE